VVLLFAIMRLIFVESEFERTVAASIVALMVLAMFDHYLWTMPLGRVIAWTPFAVLAAREHRLLGQTIVEPPLTSMHWPVTNRPDSAARNSAEYATSTGSPMRRNGNSAARATSRSGG
jgi:hypothetical protein